MHRCSDGEDQNEETEDTAQRDDEGSKPPVQS